jgi:hypothetical protein
MDCVNHTGVEASAYCQNCGRPLCTICVNTAPGGQILCQPCYGAWQSYQPPFVMPHPSGPNPSAAAALGLIPGVGAMYNGQFLKGLMHVVIFALLISITDYYPICGLFIAAWIIYQSFEAYHTARARRDGQPLPDPLGLNEVSYWLNPSLRMREAVPPTGAPAGQEKPPAEGSPQAYQPPYQAPYQPYQPPPVPPLPPACWRRREPIGAIVLIALGVLFLFGELNIFDIHWFRLVWPLALIALGIWLIVRRIGDSRGGSQ